MQSAITLLPTTVYLKKEFLPVIPSFPQGTDLATEKNQQKAAHAAAAAAAEPPKAPKKKEPPKPKVSQVHLIKQLQYFNWSDT
jgi:hypothetical protein